MKHKRMVLPPKERYLLVELEDDDVIGPPPPPPEVFTEPPPPTEKPVPKPNMEPILGGPRIHASSTQPKHMTFKRTSL